MFCSTCGNPCEGEFCSRCGSRLQSPAAPSAAPGPIPPPAAPYPRHVYPPHPFYMPRVSSHIQTLSILWFVYAGYLVLTGVFAALFLMGISTHGFLGRVIPSNTIPFAPMESLMGIVAGFVLGATLLGATLAIIAGFALINRKHWGRIFALIVAVLALIKFPAGTALGIYTLWVLAPGTSGPEYDALAHP